MRNGADLSHWDNLIQKMVKRIQTAKLLFPSVLEMANILNSYCLSLSLFWYPAPLLPISREQLKLINKAICFALWSKDLVFHSNGKYSPQMNLLRASLPKTCDAPGLDLTVVDLRISSLKCKLLNELQIHFNSENPTEHIRWLELMILRDMDERNRVVPVTSLLMDIGKTISNAWLRDAFSTYRFLPKPSLNIGDKVLIVKKDGIVPIKIVSSTMEKFLKL